MITERRWSPVLVGETALEKKRVSRVSSGVGMQVPLCEWDVSHPGKDAVGRGGGIEGGKRSTFREQPHESSSPHPPVAYLSPPVAPPTF